MIRRRVPDKGDVYWIDPNPVTGREMKDRHRWVVVSPAELNRHGVSITVAITSAGVGARNIGITVPVMGSETTGVAVCNQVRSFDIDERMKIGNARFIETLDGVTTHEICARTSSIIYPEESG